MAKFKSNKNVRTAFQFILLMGIVSLFSDITYEGARSITGPFLAFLGGNAIVVGFVSGFGEFIGYALRLVSGILSDRTKKYWLLTGLGYIINLLAVPLLALANHWELAAILLIMERAGKALRSPPRDTLLSYAAHQVGTGWGFGIHEALDQIGAVSGPLIVALVLFFKGGQNFQASFLTLGIPAVLALTILLIARIRFPKPMALEKNRPLTDNKTKTFWLYLVAASLVAAGYADFPLIAYHFKKIALVGSASIPILYSLAMGVDALAALIFGHLFDKKGVAVLALAIALSAFFAPLAFLGNLTMAAWGVALWGIGMGAQESILRATVAKLIPAGKRGSAYGLFNSVFGLCWFLGSILMGYLYELNLYWLVAFSMATQFLALPILLRLKLKN